MVSTAQAGYSDYIEGKLIAAITTSTTTGIQVKIKQINMATPTWPTVAHRIKIIQRTATNNKVEELAVAAGTTQSGQTVTLGTCTRALSLSDGTNFSGSAGTAQSFAAGADVFITWDSHDAAMTPKLDIANTFTAANTFSGGMTLSGTTATIRFPQMTTTQRDAIVSPDNGMVVYNTTTGVLNQYIGGAWTTFASGTTANASNGVAGKVDLATAAENAAGTATDASSGASNVIPTSIVKATSTGAVSGTVPMLNTSVALDRTIGGLGTVTGATAYTLIANGTTATGATQNLASAGSTNQFLMSNGASALPTFSPLIYTSKVVYCAFGDSSAAGSGSNARFTFDTHTYAIPSSDLVANVAYEVEAFMLVTCVGSYAFTAGLAIGATDLIAKQITFSGSNQLFYIHGTIGGTTAAGAAASVRSSGFVSSDTGSGTMFPSYDVRNMATNGALTIQISGKYGTSDTQSATLKGLVIKRISTTAS